MLPLNDMIYLDNASTTKPNGVAMEKSIKYYTENFFNPSSLYRGGAMVSKELNQIRERFSQIFGTKYEVFFTSCGTESDNTVINYFAKKGNVVISAGEHSAIYETAKILRNSGHDIRIAKINKNATVDKEHLFSLIDDKTSLVSIIHVNNETGGINDIEELAKACKEKNPNIVFHSDGVQAFLKTDNKLNYVDCYSISGHKIGAIKGVGAFIKKKGLFVAPFVTGGGQEKGFRSGTENVFGINTMYYATLENLDYKKNLEKVTLLKNAFISDLTENCMVLSDENCSPYIISISCVGLKSEVILHMLEDCGVIIGIGSACSKNSNSRVLTECGYSQEILQGVLRISFGFTNTIEEVKYAVQKLNECVDRLKKVMKK